jgi:hypothetical protein
LPAQVPLECAAAFLLCLLGSILMSDGFKPIYSSDEHPMNSIHRLFGPRPDTRRLEKAALTARASRGAADTISSIRMATGSAISVACLHGKPRRDGQQGVAWRARRQGGWEVEVGNTI